MTDTPTHALLWAIWFGSEEQTLRRVVGPRAPQADYERYDELVAEAKAYFTRQPDSLSNAQLIHGERVVARQKQNG